MKQLFIIFALLSFFIPACQVPGDDIGPDLDILEPDEFSNHQIGEPLLVEVFVQDDQRLGFVRIDVVNQAQNRVAGPVQYSNFSGLSDQRSVGVDITDITLNSGVYFVRVTVSDGENERTGFREINLIEVPREVLSIVCFHEIGPNAFGIDSLDRENGVFVDQTEFSPALEYFSQLGSDELAFFGSSAGRLDIVQTEDLEVIGNYSYPTGGTGPEFWRAVTAGNNLVFASSSDGQIRSWNANGSPELNIQVGFGFQADQMLLTDDYLYVEEHPVNAGLSQLAVFFTGSGVFFQSDVIEFDIIEMLPTSGGDILLFAEDNLNNGKVYRYSTSANGYSAPLTLNYMNIADVERTASGDYLVADASGIHKFRFQNGSVLQNSGLLRSGSYDQLYYDQVSGGIYAFESSLNQLHLLDPVNLSMVNSYNLPPAAQGFAILYNR